MVNFKLAAEAKRHKELGWGEAAILEEQIGRAEIQLDEYNKDLK